MYWWWRLSKLSHPYYAIKTFLFIQWNAAKIATCLDDCMNAMGQMDHPGKGSPDKGVMLMKVEVRRALVHRAAWSCLPRWKWRK